MNTSSSHRRIVRRVCVALVGAAVWVVPVGPSAAAVQIFDPQPLPVLGSSGEAFPIVGNFAGSAFDDLFAYAPGSAADRLVISQGDRTATTVGQSVSGNYDAIVGDFAGDSHDDIFWYAFNDPRLFPDSIWISNGDGTWVKRSLNILGEYRPLVGNFDGDGHDDLFWYAPGTQPDAIWTFSSSGGHTSASVTVNGFYEPAVGDFADGSAGHVGDDIVWKSFDAISPLWISTNTGFLSRYVRMPSEGAAVTGSFGGDGHDDLLVNSPGTSADAVMFGPFTTLRQIFVSGTYEPVIGDWNGDGHDDVLWDDVFDGPDPVWFGLGGDGAFTKVGQVDLEPVSAVHRVQVGDIADPGGTDDVLVFAGSEGSPINSFQLYYGIPADT